MDRDRALVECLRLGREAPDRDRYEFIPRELQGGEWQVVKLALPEGIRHNREVSEGADADPDKPREYPDSNQRSRFYW